MNTHLDDQGSQSRFEAAKIILQKIDEYQSGEFATSIAGVFLAGDFNSQETQEAYHVLTGSESSLVDTAKVVEENQQLIIS
jgi:endonuclease/exonuclease/phosphatase family metal-dependent hydrolase